MAISYPLTFPSGIIPNRFRVQSRSAVAVSQSPYSGAQQVYDWGGQWWEFEFGFPPLKAADASEVIAFLLKLNGREGTFLIGDPTRTAPRGSAPGTPLVDGGSQTGNELDTKGWTASQSNILRAGDWIQLGTNSSARLYQVLDDTNSDGDGKSTLTIWPDLRSSPSDEATIYTSDTVGVFRLKEAPPWDVSGPTLHQFTFSAVEAL